MLPHSTRTEEARPGRGEDKIATIRLRGSTVFIVADGAGGVAGGAACR
jgi:serine/threonine protein phosphatase PrpC